MFKLSEAGDLEKAGKSLGNLFAAQVAELEKSVSSHEAQATHHQALSNLHKGHSEAHQAMHDAMDNSHEMKGHMAKGAAFHKAAADHHSGLYKVHTDEADKCKAARDTMKAQADQWGGTPGPVTKLLSTASGKVTAPPTTPTGNIMVDMVTETSAQLMAKTLSMMDTDPEVQQVMREHVMKMLAEAIGSTVVPTHVSAVAPNAPGVRAVPRAGQPPAPAARPNVPIQFEKLVAIEED